jgi:hypothetical protein
MASVQTARLLLIFIEKDLDQTIWVEIEETKNRWRRRQVAEAEALAAVLLAGGVGVRVYRGGEVRVSVANEINLTGLWPKY